MRTILGEKEMKTVKSFIYLDEYKMYSISSQIFEGLTEYIINYAREEKQDQEEQKGPISSGRVLADIISKESGIHQKKFLHDYSYVLFESKLIDDKKVLLLNTENIGSGFNQIEHSSFIKITGRAVFNDLKRLNEVMKGFNEFGEALAYVTTYAEREKFEQDKKIEIENIKDRNQKALLKAQTKSKIDSKALAKKMNLQLDQEYIDKIVYLLNYGYKDQFELQIPLSSNDGGVEAEIVFTSFLKRSLLKEDEHMLIKKFSRYTERDFTLFGMVTQSNRIITALKEKESSQKFTNLKVAINNALSTFSAIDDQFIGRLSNEIIIDPIAVYQEF